MAILKYRYVHKFKLILISGYLEPKSAFEHQIQLHNAYHILENFIFKSIFSDVSTNILNFCLIFIWLIFCVISVWYISYNLYMKWLFKNLKHIFKFINLPLHLYFNFIILFHHLSHFPLLPFFLHSVVFTIFFFLNCTIKDFSTILSTTLFFL